MRPKVVLLVLLSGVGALALMGVLYGLLNKEAAQPPSIVSSRTATQPATAVSEPKPAAGTPSPSRIIGPRPGQANPTPGSVVATTPEADRAVLRSNDLDALNEAVLAGEENEDAMIAIAGRLESEDPEVRAAAREAARHFGNTNLVPFLTLALEHVEDPREKVALMDAIDYLQLPTGPDPEALNELRALRARSVRRQ